MARLTFRQGIVSHQTDTGGNPTFLAVSGANVNLVISPDFTTIAFAHGTANYLYTEQVSVNAAWGPHTGQDYWLYWEMNLATGVVTRGSTTLEPIVQAAQPNTTANGQMWFDTVKNTWFVHNGTRFIETVRVFAAKLQGGATLSSMSINAPSFKGTQVGLTSGARAGSLIFTPNGKAIKGDNNKFFTTEDTFLTGVPTAASLRINNIIVTGEATAAIPSYSVVQYNAFNKIGQANPFTQGLRLFGIIEEDASVGEVVNFITEGMISNEQWDWVAAGAGANTPVYIALNGVVSLDQVNADQLPIGIVTGPREILFAPSLFPQVSTTVAPIGSVTKAEITDFVEGEYVHTTGDETVAGIKTFTAAPISIDPTADQEVATKKYVDDNAGTPTGVVLTTTNQTVAGEKSFTDDIFLTDTKSLVMETGGNGGRIFSDEGVPQIESSQSANRSRIKLFDNTVQIMSRFTGSTNQVRTFLTATEVSSGAIGLGILEVGGVGGASLFKLVDQRLGGGSFIDVINYTSGIANDTIVFGVKARSPQTVIGDNDDTLITKKYFEDNSGGGGADPTKVLKAGDTVQGNIEFENDAAVKFYEGTALAAVAADRSVSIDALGIVLRPREFNKTNATITFDNWDNGNDPGTVPESGIQWKDSNGVISYTILADGSDGPTFMIKLGDANIYSGDTNLEFLSDRLQTNKYIQTVHTTAGSFSAAVTTKSYVDKLVPSFLPMSFAGVLPDATEVAKFVIPSAFTVETTGHPTANAGTAPSGGTAVFNIKKNGVTFGTVTFADGSTNGTVVVSAQETLAANDRITVDTVAQNGADTVSITVVLTRVM